MSKSNFIIRGGADFSSIEKEIKKTRSSMESFQSSISKTMSGIGKAIKIGLGVIGLNTIKNFIKDSIDIASDMVEVQNVVDVTFGKMAKDINEFASNSIEQFGLSELAAKTYTSSMGAMLKSSGITGDAVRDMAVDLTKLSADMASFYNLDNEEMFRKIMSGMSGMSTPLKELGVNMNIANLEAYAMANGLNKTWQEMSQAEQTVIRYNYLMSVTTDSHNDFARNSYTWANQLKILSQQWQLVKASIGEGFINILLPIVQAFNKVIAVIGKAAAYFRAFTELIFGKASTKPVGEVKDAYGGVGESIGGLSEAGNDASKGLGKAGKSAKKAGKDAKDAAKEAKGALASFDEVNLLADKSSSSKDSPHAGGGSGGKGNTGSSGVPEVDLGSVDVGEVDLGFNKIKEDLENLMNIFKEFYENWGIKDIFEGIREGAALVKFDNIKENFKIAFEGWSEIAETALEALQPIAKAGGELVGTHLKYGIAIVGNYFEPIIEGFANFTENMKIEIQSWLLDISVTIVNGLENLKNVWEIIYIAWLDSIEKYKPSISTAVEETFTNISNTLMLIGSIFADTFEIITKKLLDFVNNNKGEIQKFMDNIHKIFLDVWKLINKVWKDALDILKEFWNIWGKDIVDTLMDIVTTIGEWMLKLWNEMVQPVWDKMVKWMNKIWEETLKDIVKELVGFVGRVGELIGEVWNKILKPLLDWLVETFGPRFGNVFSLIIEIIGPIIQSIGDLIKGLMEILNGLLDFILGVFTADWQRAWNGVKKIFKGVFDALAGIFKAPFNIIISGINTFLRAINRVKIPDWVPGVGGFGFDIPEIPHLARGGVIDKPTIAMVGEAGKEVVMPLENNTGWINELASKLNSSGGSSNEDIVINLDGREVARILKPSLENENSRVGRTILRPT